MTINEGSSSDPGLKPAFEAPKRVIQMSKRSQPGRPYLLFLVNSHHYVINDEYLNADSEGVAKAIIDIKAAIAPTLHSTNLHDCKVLVYVFANLTSLSAAARQHGLSWGEGTALPDFARDFVMTDQDGDLFEFVQVSEEECAVEGATQAMLVHRMSDPECERIFYAACHSDRHIPHLRLRSPNDKKIILVHGPTFHHRWVALDLPLMKIPTIFRSSPLKAVGTALAVYKAPDLDIPKHVADKTSVTRRPRMCSFAQRGKCRFNANTCGFFHPNDAESSERGTSHESNDVLSVESEALNKSTTPAAAEKGIRKNARPHFRDLPMEGTFDSSQIPVTQNGHQLDSRIQRPSQLHRAQSNAQHTKPKLCKPHHLAGSCEAGESCKYDHNLIPRSHVLHLRYFARKTPCPQGGECRASDCFWGHICQEPSCRRYGGRLPCEVPQEMYLDQEAHTQVRWFVSQGPKAPQPMMEPAKGVHLLVSRVSSRRHKVITTEKPGSFAQSIHAFQQHDLKPPSEPVDDIVAVPDLITFD